MADGFGDIVAITQLIQAWGHCRDQGRWGDLARTFTPDGTINVTWFTGAFSDFVGASRKVHQPRSPRIKHLIGLPSVNLQGDRALAETNIQILGRFRLDNTDVDYTSYARFLDRLVRTADGWKISARTAIYEKDRLDPAVPSEDFVRTMSETDFSGVPEPYRYLGYRLLISGRQLHPDIICDGSPEMGRLLSNARQWLAVGG
ncbi:nuclear transport factor 2 family protein [Aquicoccus porphyridii]|nr:nuclear transport factor 2 family protein [Aquicoccus porphyridii]RAI52130.1 hypothetical protein DOO74_19700 [Rhodobacteraceae bacterium AsT-22]